jgi:hypothetical protein
VISALPHRRREMLDLMVRWYLRDKKDTLRYLGSMLQKDGDIDKDV